MNTKAPSNACPPTEALKALLAEPLPDSDQEVCARHLDECDCCRAKLEELATGGTNLSQLVQKLNEEVPSNQSAYWPAIKAVEKVGRAGGDIVHVAVTAVAPTLDPAYPSRLIGSSSATNFLLPPSDPSYLGRLAHFDVMRVIGRGGMGIVLEAFDSKLQRHVALKVLDPELLNDETARQRFCREARAAASITHDNVVAVHDVQKADGDQPPYLVMQLITGETLEQRLVKQGKMPVKEIVRIALQAANGLAAAHAQGLIHRDIKPANILLEPPHDKVKLTDFGLARVVDDGKLTRTGFVAGTPLYMAPEQALGESADPRSDLFSLGAILYEMCTGRPPFQGKSALAILKEIAESKHQPVREINPEIPEWLAEIVDDLLAKKPADRYQSAAELVEVLEFHWTHVKTSSVDLPSVCVHEMRQRQIRNRIVIATVGVSLLVVGLIAGMIFGRGSGIPAAPVSAAEAAAVLPANSGTAWSLAFHPHNDTVAMAVEDGTVRLWDWPKQAVQETFDAHRGIVWIVRYSHDGKFLATTGDDGLLKIWTLDKQEPIKIFTHPNAVRGLAIGSDDKLYAGDRQGGLHVWTLDSDQPLLEAQQPGAIYGVAISPDGKTLATAGSDKIVRLWNAETLKQRLPLEGHNGPVNGLSFSPDGKELASAGWDGTIRIWDPAGGKLLREWDGQSGDVWSIAYSPAGGKLATGGTDGSVRVWDAKSQKLLATYLGHKHPVHTISFNHDGTLLGSGGRDGAVRIWRMER